jgi:hypothetical protein
MKEWFDIGAAAAARVFNTADLYVCPLCIRGFDQSALTRPASREDRRGFLTREHVPPECFGGRNLVLTCADCNHTAGFKIDGELAKFARFQDFFRQVPGQRMNGRIKIGGTEANVLYEWKSDTDGEKRLEITDYRKLNHPRVEPAVNQALETMATDTQGFELEMRSYKIGYPEISLLRAAYLAAFAKLGYRFVCRPVFDIVRKQIIEPDTQSLGNFYFNAERLDPEKPLIGFVLSPEWACALMVQLGPHRILLPVWDDDDVYTRMTDAASRNASAHVTARIVLWPQGPEHLFDFWPNRTMRELKDIFSILT